MQARTSPSQEKSPEPISSEVSLKAFPQASPPGVVFQLKTGARSSEHTSFSTNQAEERSPKVVERKSPRSSISEKKQLEDQLCSSDTSTKQAQKDLEETNEQVVASKKQLLEFSVSEEVHTDQDQTSHESVATLALASALDEIKQLKAEHALESTERVQEVNKLKESLAESLSLVTAMKNQVEELKKSNAKADAKITEVMLQFGMAIKKLETLESEKIIADKRYDAIENKIFDDYTFEVAHLRSPLKAAEKRYNEEQADQDLSAATLALASALDEIKKLKAEHELEYTEREQEVHTMKESLAESLSLVTEMKKQVKELKESKAKADAKVTEVMLQIGIATKKVETLESEKIIANKRYDAIENKIFDDYTFGVAHLRSPLKAAEIRYNEEQADQDQISNESAATLALASELDEIKQLKPEHELEYTEREQEVHTLKESLAGSLSLVTELKNQVKELKESTAKADAKVTEVMLQFEIATKKLETLENAYGMVENIKSLSGQREAKAATLAEQLEAATLAEQLEAAEARVAEREDELRKLKVQSNQWRKAAETASAMLSPRNNNDGQLLERTRSLNNNHKSNDWKDKLALWKVLKKKNASNINEESFF